MSRFAASSHTPVALRPDEFHRFTHSAGPGSEKKVGISLPHLRGKGARRGLKHRRPEGSTFDPRGIPHGLLEASWDVLGVGRPQEGALGGKGGVEKYCGRFKDPSWGPLVPLGIVLGRLSLLGGSRRSFLFIFWGTSRLRAFRSFLSIFYSMFALCCLPCRVAGGAAHM